MKKLLIAGAALALAASLSGCAGFAANTNQAELLKQLDTNFARCDRHITFQAGVGVVTPGAQISGSVDCKGAGDVPAAAPSVSKAAAATAP